MIRFLAKILMDDPDKYDDPGVRRVYGMLCGAVGIGLNILLFAAKYLAGLLSHSIAITADAFNNLSDAGSSVITLLGFKIAGRKADSEHPFGHGQAEYVAGLIVAIVIIFMGFDLAKTSVQKIFSPEPVEFSLISTCILGASILVKLYMWFYNRRVSRKIDSAAMGATATDSLSDACATLAVLISTFIARFTGVNIDAYAGALVALLILWGGYNAAKDTITPLLGRAPDPELVRHIRAIVKEYKEVIGVHDLIVHEYGAGNLMVSLHAEVPSDGDMNELHDVIDTIEQRLKTELHCHAVIHMDPLDTNDSLVGETRGKVQEAVRAALDAPVSIHDFRMVTGPTHTNVIFDAVIPNELSISDEQARKEIVQAVSKLPGHYNAVVTIDKPYLGEEMP